MLNYSPEPCNLFYYFFNHLAVLSKSNVFLSFPLTQMLSPTTHFTKSNERLPPAESISRCRAGCDTAHILGTKHTLYRNVGDEGPRGLIHARIYNIVYLYIVMITYLGVRLTRLEELWMVPSEKPWRLPPDPNKPSTSRVSIILNIFFKQSLCGQLLHLFAFCKRHSQEMMQLSNESRNLTAQPRFRNAHETRAEGNRMQLSFESANRYEQM